MTPLAERIREIRQKRGLSQAAFAGMLGVTQRTFSRYELGQSSPDARIVVEICRFAGVTADWLLFGSASGASAARDGIDRQLLAQIIETVDEVLPEMGKAPGPADRADIIAGLYQLLLEDREAGTRPAVILRYIRGALAANE